MPPRKGSKQHNLALSDTVSDQLAALALRADFAGSKSAAMEAALTAFIAGNLDAAVAESLQTKLHTMEYTLTNAYSTIPVALEKVVVRMQALEQRLQEVEERLTTHMNDATHQQERWQRDMVSAFDRLSGRRRTGRKTRWFLRLFTRPYGYG